MTVTRSVTRAVITRHTVAVGGAEPLFAVEVAARQSVIARGKVDIVPWCGVGFKFVYMPPRLAYCVTGDVEVKLIVITSHGICQVGK